MGPGKYYRGVYISYPGGSNNSDGKLYTSEVMNDISITLALLKAGLKTRKKSFYLQGWRFIFYRFLKYFSVIGFYLGLLYLIFG